MIRVLMDYHIAMKSLDCPYTVTFYGAMFREVKKKIPFQHLFFSLPSHSLSPLHSPSFPTPLSLSSPNSLPP